jgi:hypothetical protein
MMFVYGSLDPGQEIFILNFIFLVLLIFIRQWVDPLRTCIAEGVENECSHDAARFVDSLLYFSAKRAAKNLMGCEIAQPL